MNTRLARAMSKEDKAYDVYLRQCLMGQHLVRANSRDEYALNKVHLFVDQFVLEGREEFKTVSLIWWAFFEAFAGFEEDYQFPSKAMRVVCEQIAYSGVLWKIAQNEVEKLQE